MHGETGTSDDVQRGESIRRALARIEKHERIVKIRAVVIRVLALAAAVWFALDTRHPLTLLGVECRVIILLALVMGVCTERVRLAVNQNTRTVLEAIEESRSKF